MEYQGNWEHNFIDNNGVKIHYVTQGEGKLMLMLHGFPAFWYSWRHQIPEFSAIAQGYQASLFFYQLMALVDQVAVAAWGYPWLNFSVV